MKKSEIIVGTIYVIIAIWLFITIIIESPQKWENYVKNNKDLRENAVYTSCRINELKGKGNSFNYEYTVNGKKYKEGGGSFAGDFLFTKRYLVVYSSKNPQNSRCFTDIVIPDEITDEELSRQPVDFSKIGFLKSMFGQHYQGLIALFLMWLIYYVIKKIFRWIKNLFSKKSTTTE